MKPILARVALTLSTLSVLFGVAGCTPSHRLCELDDALLEVADLPGSAWQDLGPRTVRGAPSRLGIGRIGTSFQGPGGGLVHQIIYRFGAEEEADEVLAGLAEDWFALAPEESGCKQDASLPTALVGASEASAQCCASPSGHTVCMIVARYGTDIIQFSADMISLDATGLPGVLDTLDSKMVACAGVIIGGRSP